MKKSISAYTQAYNLINKNYPWKESIKSFSEFCDEVIIVDGGSNDGTYEELLNISNNNKKIKLYQVARDWSQKGFSIFDGLQKAESRKRCSGEWCLQFDIDELIHESHYDIIYEICKNCPENIDLLSFPFVEFWGSKGKIRSDFLPIKNRLSRNKDYITHGIPNTDRVYNKDGTLSSIRSDGCCYIRNDNYEIINSFSIFDIKKMEALRIKSFSNNKLDITNYENYYNSLIKNMPVVFHYSWINIYKKLKIYPVFWQKHWADLYNKNSTNNMIFNKPWSEVSDQEIKDFALKLEKEMCGWIFHSKVDFSKSSPHIYFNGNHPKIILDWLINNEQMD